MKNKLLALLLALFIACAMLPLAAFAEEGTGNGTTPVAAIGDTKHDTLQAAIDAAEANGTITEITLLGDVTEDIVIASGKNIVLDLNGHTITNSYTSTNKTYADTITNNGTLTIKDTKGSGSVDNISSWSTGGSYSGSANNKQLGSAIRNNEGATVTLNGGKYYRSKEAGDGSVGSSGSTGGNTCYTLRNQGEMIINPGVAVENQGTYSAMIANGYFNGETDNPNGTNYPKLTINGGTFTGGKYNVKNDDYGVLEVNGGNFTINQNYNIFNCNELTINGGNFVNKRGYNIYAWMDPDCAYEDGELKITGGKFTTEYSTTWCLFIDPEAIDLIEITGGTYNNSTATDNWRISGYISERSFKGTDVQIIPNTHTKIAVGTVDEDNYVFKVVPIKEEEPMDVTVHVGDTTTLKDWANERIQKLKEDNTGIENATRINDAENLSAISNDNVKVELVGAAEGNGKDIQISGLQVGEYTFSLEFAAGDNGTPGNTDPQAYASQTVHVKVVPANTGNGGGSSGIDSMLNTTDHYSYIVGYPDGTVRPNASISRAEVAEIFFRLLTAEVRDGNLTSTNTFEDVTVGMWCNKSISTMAALGIVKGRSAERYDPNAPITRAEFAAICARFDTGLTDGDSDFSDISGHWAEAEIERAASLGWIVGYTDGTFRPDQHITRGEAMTIINRVLHRIPGSENDLLDGMRVWPDNNPGDWYYLAVQEATNSHEFTAESEIHESWTKLTSDPDWTRYQD